MKVFKNTETYLELVVLNQTGNFISGLSITCNIYRSFDDSLFSSKTLIEVGTSGVYKSSIIFTEIGQFRIVYTTPYKYDNAIETILVDDIDEQIKRILGLSQENYRIFNPSYDSRNNLLSGKIKIYSSASDVDTDTNAIANYSITAVYDGQNQMTSYKVKKT